MRISLDGMNMRISLNNGIRFDEIEVLESDLMEWKYENQSGWNEHENQS